MIFKCLWHAKPDAVTLLTGKGLPKFQKTVPFSSSWPSCKECLTLEMKALWSFRTLATICKRSKKKWIVCLLHVSVIPSSLLLTSLQIPCDEYILQWSFYVISPASLLLHLLCMAYLVGKRNLHFPTIYLWVFPFKTNQFNKCITN